MAIGQICVDGVGACAQLAATRQGEPIDRWVDSFFRAVEAPDQLVLVARHDEQIVGSGKATWMELPEGSNAPTGWYLTGVVVDPRLRRRGVGEQLTAARLATLRQRGARRVWFFANARNEASLALHTQLGFREVTRDFTIPGVAFDGGEGVLAQWSAPG